MDIEKLTKKLIEFRTTQENPDEIKKCLHFISEQFSNSKLHVHPFIQEGEQSLVISTSKGRVFDAILSGHIDVVPAAKKLFTPQKEGKKIFGRGACDMKGAVAAMIQVMLELDSWKTKPKVALMITSDEEIGGFNGTKFLLEKEGFFANCVIVPDGGYNFNLCTESKGVLPIQIVAEGKSAHASQPWLGDNAIEKLITIGNEIRKNFPLSINPNSWGTTLNIGTISGGTSRNSVPNHAEMFLDIRHPSHTNPRDIFLKIERICATINGVTPSVLNLGSCMHTKEDNVFLRKFGESILKTTKVVPKFMKEFASSDGRFFSENKIPVIMTMCKSSLPHSDDEWVDIEGLKQLKEIVLNFIIKIQNEIS